MNKFKVLLVAVLIFSPAVLRAEHKQVRIGMVMDGPGVAYGQMLEEIKKEIRALLEGEFEAVFPELSHILAVNRTKELLETRAEIIVTHCPVCIMQLKALPAQGTAQAGHCPFRPRWRITACSFQGR